jgi:hypothetical protein
MWPERRVAGQDVQQRLPAVLPTSVDSPARGRDVVERARTAVTGDVREMQRVRERPHSSTPAEKAVAVDAGTAVASTEAKCTS